jgi:hypothetical protein
MGANQNSVPYGEKKILDTKNDVPLSCDTLVFSGGGLCFHPWSHRVGPRVAAWDFADFYDFSAIFRSFPYVDSLK